jgi:hypothetical protein
MRVEIPLIRPPLSEAKFKELKLKFRIEEELQNIKKRRPTISTPKDVRKDMLGH